MSEVCRLLDVGVRIERQARNADVTRQELVVTILAPFMNDVVELFKEVNTIEDPQVRLETWALRADGFLDQHVPLKLREPKK